MIEDKKEEEKLIQYSQYRKKGLLSDISLSGSVSNASAVP
jgi:hypothetical protein